MTDEKPLVEEDEVAFEEPQEDKTPKPNDELEPDVSADNRKRVVEKMKHWRDKAQKTSTRVQELEEELRGLREAVKKPDDEKERNAQEYIRARVLEVMEERDSLKKKEEAQERERFNSEVETILEENPNFSEEELLDTIEEYEVVPEVALKILKKQQSPKEKKPRMPQARRGSPEGETKPPDDSKKSMWDILKEESAKLRNK